MNKHDAHDYIPLLQAMGDGKTIQFKRIDSEWEDLETTEFTYSAKNYRVKPEPRTFDIWVNRYNGAISDYVSPDRHDHSFWEHITVLEVLK
jgi:hypothetical protein